MQQALIEPATTMPDYRPPLRAIARIIDAWSFDIIHEWVQLFGGDTRLAEVWLFVKSANTRHFLDDPAFAAGYRPVKIRTIAAALGFNFEAVRRKVATLRAAGVCLVNDQGVIALLPDGASSFVSQTDGLPTRLMTLVARLRTLILDNGYDLTAVAEIRTALDYDFSSLVDSGTQGSIAVLHYLASTLLSGAMLFEAERDSAAIYFTIYVESERALAHDPQLSRADGWIESECLDWALQPVTARRITERLGIPAETVRRKINRLVDKGLITRVPGGMVVTRAPDVFQVHANRVYGNLLTTLAAMRRIGAVPPA